MDGKVTPDRGVYGISVAAELVGAAPPALRLYERRGLLEPQRTQGGTRRYSERDLERLRRIAELLGDGLNLAGIGMVLALEAANAQLRDDLAQARDRATTQAKRRRSRSSPDVSR